MLADNCGDRIAAVTIEEGDGKSFLKFHGYTNIGSRYYDGEGFHGRMAMSKSKYGIIAIEISPTAWIFPIQGFSTHSNLDRRDGNCRKFDDEFTRGEGL